MPQKIRNHYLMQQDICIEVRHAIIQSNQRKAQDREGIHLLRGSFIISWIY